MERLRKRTGCLLVALWCKQQSMYCLCCRRMEEGLTMTPVTVQCGKEPNHHQTLAGCGGNWGSLVPEGLLFWMTHGKFSC